VGDTEEGNKVVLTNRIHGNVTDDDDFVVIDFEGFLEVGCGVFGEAAANFLVEFGDALGCVEKSVAVGVFADGKEDFANGVFDAFMVDFEIFVHELFLHENTIGGGSCERA
jgi:hypothetical protein